MKTYLMGGEEIKLREITYREMRNVGKVEDGEARLLTLLSCSAVWRKTGDQVWRDAEAVEGTPAKYSLLITRMANDAYELNAPEPDPSP
jgi:hypothetical protein